MGNIINERKKVVDICFSINVHEKRDFLIKQIKNINDHVKLNYIIIINANEYMYNEISNCQFIKSKDNVVLNKNWLNKKRYHGSLTNGICLNMEEALKHYTFKYFIILSSRNLFYNKITKETIDNEFPFISKSGWGRKDSIGIKRNKLNIQDWHWHSFLKTKLSKYIIDNDMLFSSSPHEGLCFNYISCQTIIEFLNNNTAIKEDLFNWNHCVEEFSLQTICINLAGSNYYYLGNGCKTHHNIEMLPKNRYTYKTYRI